MTQNQILPYGRQSIDQSDLDAVLEVLQGDWLTQGPAIASFEQDFAEYCGARFAVAVSNGTAALHLANLALHGNEPGEVITTPISFAATSNSILYVGGTPVFVDINAQTLSLDAERVEAVLGEHESVKGIIPVHLGGVVADMEHLSRIAVEHDLWIIEDACHALGGTWIDSRGLEHRVGDCAFSQLSIFSFHPVKQLTTGEGGAITTNDEGLYALLKELRTHGITRNPERMLNHEGGWYYEMRELGFNYRMTDIQAALGSSQLKRSDSWARRRREIVAQYDVAFASEPRIHPQHHPGKGSPSYHLYIIRVPDREGLYNALREEGIMTQVHYIPIHLQPFYRQTLGTNPGQFPEAEKYYAEALSLPLFPGMSNDDVDRVIEAVRRYHD